MTELQPPDSDPIQQEDLPFVNQILRNISLDAELDAKLAKLRGPVPRSIRRRRKTENFDAWSIQKTVFGWLVASILCVIVGWVTFPWGMALLIFGVPLIPLFLWMSGPTLLKVFDHRFLVRYGHAVMGRVTSYEFLGTGDFGGGLPNITYEFETARGERIGRKWCEADNPFFGHKQGDRFIVLYNPHDPTQNIAYDSALFEAK